MSMVLANSSAQDTEVVNPPTDSISAVSFSPTADILGVTSWDNTVSLWFCRRDRLGAREGKKKGGREGTGGTLVNRSLEEELLELV